MIEKTKSLQAGSLGDGTKTSATAPDTPAHTPLRLSAGDETRIMDNKGFPLIDVPCGGMTGRRVKDAEQIAAFIVRACNSHYQLVDSLRGLLDEIAKSPCADSILDSTAAGHAFAALSQAGGASE